jgi:hypothetical protein
MAIGIETQRDSAPMFSCRWGSFEVPGIGSIADEWATAHASATCGRLRESDEALGFG